MAFDTLWPELTFHTSVSCAHLSGNVYKYLRNSQYKSLNLRTHYGAINALRHHPFCTARQETQVPSLAEHVEGEETGEVDKQARSHQAAWHFTKEAHLASDKFAWHWTSLLTTRFRPSTLDANRLRIWEDGGEAAARVTRKTSSTGIAARRRDDRRERR